MRRYLLTQEAKEDLADIRDYLKREAGPRVAKSTLEKIKGALLFLSRTPGAGHSREDLFDRRRREILAGLLVPDYLPCGEAPY